MKVLFIAAEASPWVKVGGLADVVGELPRYLRSLEVEVRVALPYYPTERQRDSAGSALGEFNFGGTKVTVFPLKNGNLDTLFIGGDMQSRHQTVYGELVEDTDRFTKFSLAAMQMCQVLDWQPDLLHAHDWHTAPAVVWLKGMRLRSPFWQDTKSLLTIHNLPYMGGELSADWDFHKVSDSDHRLPRWAMRKPLPLGITSADWLSTVSPTYAQEIQTPEFGKGLEGVLQQRAHRLRGILNGIDYQNWDPGADPALPYAFDRNTLPAREQNGRLLREELGLGGDPEGPMIGMITRLDYQKGVDVGLDALSTLAGEPWEFVLLGTGDPAITHKAGDFSNRYSERVRFVNGFDHNLARRIYGGSDILLIPSRYEPCGLSQMIGMRYGSVPLARSTGGLRDTVYDVEARGRGNGFLFDEPTTTAAANAIRRAFAVYRDENKWLDIQQNGMAMDFSWNQSASKYLALYEQIVQASQYD